MASVVNAIMDMFTHIKAESALITHDVSSGVSSVYIAPDVPPAPSCTSMLQKVQQQIWLCFARGVHLYAIQPIESATRELRYCSACATADHTRVVIMRGLRALLTAVKNSQPDNRDAFIRLLSTSPDLKASLAENIPEQQACPWKEPLLAQ